MDYINLSSYNSQFTKRNSQLMLNFPYGEIIVVLRTASTNDVNNEKIVKSFTTT